MSILMRIVAKLLYLAAMALFVYFAIVLIDDFGVYNVVDYKQSFGSVVLTRFATICLPSIALIVVGAILDWKS